MPKKCKLDTTGPSDDVVMMLKSFVGVANATFFLAMVIATIVVSAVRGFNNDDMSVLLFFLTIVIVTGLQYVRAAMLGFTKIRGHYKNWYSDIGSIHASGNVIVETVMFTLFFSLLTVITGSWFHDVRHRDLYDGRINQEGAGAAWMTPNDRFLFSVIVVFALTMAPFYFYFVVLNAFNYFTSDDGRALKNVLPTTSKPEVVGNPMPVYPAGMYSSGL